MKLTNCLITYALIGISIQSSPSYGALDNTDCKNPYQRKEIRSMTVLEVKQLIKAFRKIRESLVWDKLVRYHFASDKYAHGNPIFLPFHRLLLREFEKEIQKYYPKLYLPYWNWAIDSQNPEKSVILTNYYFGGNGNSKEGFILDEGHFAFDIIPVPEEGYLKRQFDNYGKINAFTSLEDLEDIINRSDNYTMFNEEIGMGPHATVHDGIGGDVGHLFTMASPGDPLFFLHHCFIDMLWWNWQQRKGEIGMEYVGEDANPNESIIPWGVPVYKLLNTRRYGNCYTYPEFKVEIPKMIKINATRMLTAGMRTNRKPSNNALEELSLDSLMEKIKNGEIEGETVDSSDREQDGKIRSTRRLSPKFMKMFNIKPKDALRQHERFELLNKALNIAKNFEPKTKLQIEDPEELVPKGLKDWDGETL